MHCDRQKTRNVRAIYLIMLPAILMKAQMCFHLSRILLLLLESVVQSKSFTNYPQSNLNELPHAQMLVL